MMEQIATRPVRLSLDGVFIEKLPYLAAQILVDKFDGDPTLTFLQFSQQDTTTRQEVRHNKKWKWATAREVYISNTTAQAGKELILLLADAGAELVGGTPSMQITDSNGALLDPATEGKQDDAITVLGSITAQVTKAGTVALYNVTMTSADTEYSQALPTDTKKIAVHTRDYSAFRLAFVTGKVAASTEPFLTIGANMEYVAEDITLASGTIYVASASAGKVAEIEVWT